LDKKSNIIIRPAKPEDWSGILKAHHDAVMHKTSGHYTQEQKEAWIESMRTDIDERKESVQKGEVIALVAEYDGHIVGFATSSPSRNRLLQLYVAPAPCRGAGKKLLLAIEEKAVQSGAMFLEGSSTVNAVEFYRRNGYKIGQFNERELTRGILMQGYIIRKQLKL